MRCRSVLDICFLRKFPHFVILRGAIQIAHRNSLTVTVMSGGAGEGDDYIRIFRANNNRRSRPEDREGINVDCPVGWRGFFVYNWQQISTVNTPLYTVYWFRVYNTRLGILSFFKLNYTESSL